MDDDPRLSHLSLTPLPNTLIITDYATASSVEVLSSSHPSPPPSPSVNSKTLSMSSTSVDASICPSLISHSSHSTDGRKNERSSQSRSKKAFLQATNASYKLSASQPAAHPTHSHHHAPSDHADSPNGAYDPDHPDSGPLTEPDTPFGNSAAGRWLRRVSSAPNTKAWIIHNGGVLSALASPSRDSPTLNTIPSSPNHLGPSHIPPVPPLPHLPPNATGFGQHADGTFFPPSPSPSSLSNASTRASRKSSKSISHHSHSKSPIRSRTGPHHFSPSLSAKAALLSVPSSPVDLINRGGFRRTYSSNSIKVSKAEVGPHSFEKIRLLGKGDVGRVYLVREKPTSVDIEPDGSPSPPRLYAMKVLNKKEMIQRNKIKRALAEQVRAPCHDSIHCLLFFSPTLIVLSGECF